MHDHGGGGGSDGGGGSGGFSGGHHGGSGGGGGHHGGGFGSGAGFGAGQHHRDDGSRDGPDPDYGERFTRGPRRGRSQGSTALRLAFLMFFALMVYLLWTMMPGH